MPASHVDVAYTLLAQAGRAGLTYKELLTTPGYDGNGHGSASADLTRLHAAGRVARLVKGKRRRCSVYVLPEFVDGRQTQPYRSYTDESRDESLDPTTVKTLVRMAECVCACTCGARAPAASKAVTPEEEEELLAWEAWA